MRAVHRVSRVLTAAFVLATASSALAADDGAWIGQQILGRGLAHRHRRAAGFA